jgi:hypothetical protein
VIRSEAIGCDLKIAFCRSVNLLCENCRVSKVALPKEPSQNQFTVTLNRDKGPRVAYGIIIPCRDFLGLRFGGTRWSGSEHYRFGI